MKMKSLPNSLSFKTNNTPKINYLTKIKRLKVNIQSSSKRWSKRDSLWKLKTKEQWVLNLQPTSKTNLDKLKQYQSLILTD